MVLWSSLVVVKYVCIDAALCCPVYVVEVIEKKQELKQSKGKSRS